jgi:transposase-like protein
MLWIDSKYVNLISYRLEKFKQVDKNLFNCRCPFCGDSQKNKHKARGYFYTKNENTLLFHCHNCGITRNVRSFLQQFDKGLYDEYSKELLKEGLSFQRPRQTVGINAKEKDITVAGPPKFVSGTPLQALKRVSQLRHDHPVKAYCERRKIPSNQHYRIFFAPKFKEWVNTFIPGKFQNIESDEPRLILPFLDTNGDFIGISARALTKKEPRYYTIYYDRTKPRLFGLDTCKLNERVYVTEGPVDSLFLPNALAMMGTDINVVTSIGIDKSKLVFVLDNQPRNPEVCKVIEKIIESGYNIFLWPESYTVKDINDLVLKGLKVQDIKLMIDCNIHSGLQAKLKFTQWKKV